MTTPPAAPQDSIYAITLGRELAGNLRWQIALRWAAVLILLGSPAICQDVFGVSLHTQSILFAAGLLGACNAGYWLLHRRLENPARRSGKTADQQYHALTLFANLQIFGDLAILFVILRFNGGIENPIIYFFSFHMIIGSILLKKKHVYRWAILIMLGMFLLSALEFHGLIRHYAVGNFLSHSLYGHPTYWLGSLAILCATLFVTVYMTSSITDKLRHNERQLFTTKRELEVACAEQKTLYEQMKLLEERKSKFLLMSAHQLKSPIATIKTILCVINQKYLDHDDARKQEILRGAEARCDDLLHLATDILELARMREIDYHNDVREVNLREISLETVENLRPLAEKSGVALAVELSPDLPVIRGVPKGLKNVVYNLLDNAIKYSSQRPAAQVTYTLTCDQARKVITGTVHDNGPGIPPEEHERIFGEFYRTPDAHKSNKMGTGLGLSIVKNALDTHHGTIRLESRVGEGTTFIFTIPGDLDLTKAA